MAGWSYHVAEWHRAMSHSFPLTVNLVGIDAQYIAHCIETTTLNNTSITSLNTTRFSTHYLRGASLLIYFAPILDWTSQPIQQFP